MKILFVNYSMNIGGIETFIMNVIKTVNLKENTIDILCYKDGIYDYENEINNYRCNIIKISEPKKVSIIKHILEIKKVIKKGKYDVVHCNTYFDSMYVMLASVLCGVKVRVVHSHTAEACNPPNLLKKIKWGISKIFISILCNRKIACSDLAGKALFGNKSFEILENGVDINKFTYNEVIRNSLRKKYKIDKNNIVIGHIGRFSKVKNHEFIIKIFEKIYNKDNRYILFLVGDGPEFINIKELVKLKHLENSVIMVGNVIDSYKYYNIMDVLFFPSIYEGLPLTFVEAQINGLNIIASDSISKQSNLIGNVTFLDLNDSDENWCTQIKEKNLYRNFDNNYFVNSNYNLNNTVKKLLFIYKNKR